jgi:hypothetical protein
MGTHTKKHLDAKISSYTSSPSCEVVKEIGKHIIKVASSSMSSMTSIEELLAWKFSKIHNP